MPVGVQKNVEDGDVAIGAPKHDAYTKNEETENIVEPGNGENNSKDGSSNECFVDKQLKESVEVKPIKCSTGFLFTSESGKQKGISEFEMLSTSLDSYERGENESTEESTLLQPTTNGKISHNESRDIPQSLELLDFVEGLEVKNEHILDEGSDSGRDEGPREETLSGQLPKIKDLPMKVFLKAERVEYSVQEESDLEDMETGLEYNVTSINGQLPKDIFVLPHWPKRFWELIYVLNNHDIKLSLEVRIDIKMERITWLTGVVVIMKSFNDDNNSLTCLNLGDRMVSSSIVQTALLLFLFDPDGSHISQKFGDYLFPNYDILFENEMTDAAALLNNAHLGGEIKVPTCVIGEEYIYVISISKGLGKVGVDTAIADIVGGEMLIIFCQHFVVVAYSNFPLLGQPMKPYSDDDQHQAREGRINMSHLFVTHIHRSSNRLPATISIVLCWIHVYGIERSSHIYNLLAGAVVTYGMVLHDGEVRSTNNNNPYITIPLSQVTFGFLTNTDSRNTAISVVYVGDNIQNIIETWFDLLCFHEKSLGGSIVFFMIHKNCTAMKYIANMLGIVYSDLVHYSDAKIWPKEYMLKVMNEALTEEMGGSDSDGMDYKGLAQKYFLKEMEKELTGSPDITNMLNLIEAKMPCELCTSKGLEVIEEVVILARSSSNSLIPGQFVAGFISIFEEYTKGLQLIHGTSLWKLTGMESVPYCSLTIIFPSCGAYNNNLTRGRVMSCEGWNNENSDTDGKFISVNMNVVTCLSILCKNGQFMETSKLFHKMVNGVDPPKGLSDTTIEVANESSYIIILDGAFTYNPP